VPKPKSSPGSVLRLVRSDEGRLELDEIYRAYGRYVAAVILRLDGRATDVDDLVQDVFVAAAAGLAQIREPEAIKGWLATITVRIVRRRLQWRRLWRFFGGDRGIELAEPADPGASPLDRALLSAVYRVLDEMPTENRLAFSLHVIEGEPMETVATLCGCSFSTAKRRVSRAQRQIAERFSDG